MNKYRPLWTTCVMYVVKLESSVIHLLICDKYTSYLIGMLSAIYSHSTDYWSYFAIFYRLLVNNLLLNSCYSGWIITPKLRKDLDFSKSSISKRKKVKLQRLRRRANLNQDHSLKNPQTIHLSYLRVDERRWKRSVKSIRPQPTTVQALQLQASVRKVQTSTRSFRFALFKCKYNTPSRS